MRAVLGQGLKEASILNPSDFVLTLLYVTGFLILQVFSINLKSTEIWFSGKLGSRTFAVCESTVKS
jgi:hypothetical protein